MRESFEQLITESRNLSSEELDRLSIADAAALMNRLDSEVPAAVGRAIPEITQRAMSCASQGRANPMHP